MEVTNGGLKKQSPDKGQDGIAEVAVEGRHGPGGNSALESVAHDELGAASQFSDEGIKVAEVVRDLWRREQDRGLSAGEKRMLAKARQILVSELALAEKTNEDKAEAILDEVLAS